MTAGHPAGERQGLYALLPRYDRPRLWMLAILAAVFLCAWGLGDPIIGAVAGDDEFLAEDLAAWRALLLAASGTLLAVLGLGEEILLAALLAGMTGVSFAQVVMRYVFGTGLIWGLEVTSYMFAWLVLIGISYGIRVNAHIGIDLAVKLLPAVTRRIVGSVAVGLSLIYTGFMLYGGYGYLARLQRLGIEAEDIPLDRWLLTIILPVGMLLLGLRLLEVLYGIVTGSRDGFELPDEASEIIKESGLIDEGEIDSGSGSKTANTGGAKP